MKKNNLKQLVSNLPKYPSILGRHRLFNSAVLIPLVKIKGEYHLLFQKRAATIRQGGDICFPGGGFEIGVDKSFKDTALRETFEELGIQKKDIKVLGQLDTYVAPIDPIIESFVEKVNKKAILFLQPEWSKREEITPLIVDYVMKNPRWRVSLQTHKYLNIP